MDADAATTPTTASATPRPITAALLLLLLLLLLLPPLLLLLLLLLLLALVLGVRGSKCLSSILDELRLVARASARLCPVSISQPVFTSAAMGYREENCSPPSLLLLPWLPGASPPPTLPPPLVPVAVLLP